MPNGSLLILHTLRRAVGPPAAVIGHFDAGAVTDSDKMATGTGTDPGATGVAGQRDDQRRMGQSVVKETTAGPV